MDLAVWEGSKPAWQILSVLTVLENFGLDVYRLLKAGFPAESALINQKMVGRERSPNRIPYTNDNLAMWKVLGYPSWRQRVEEIVVRDVKAELGVRG